MVIFHSYGYVSLPEGIILENMISFKKKHKHLGGGSQVLGGSYGKKARFEKTFIA